MPNAGMLSQQIQTYLTKTQEIYKYQLQMCGYNLATTGAGRRGGAVKFSVELTFFP